MGGFEEPCIFNEDMIFAAKTLKKGYSVAYAADARVIHSHNYTTMQQFHRNFDNGVSQAMHPEVFAKVSPEGEGFHMVMDTAAYLNSIGRSYMIPQLIWQTAFKYAGFRMGKIYDILPSGMVRKLTMNKDFWSYSNIEDE